MSTLLARRTARSSDESGSTLRRWPRATLAVARVVAASSVLAGCEATPPPRSPKPAAPANVPVDDALKALSRDLLRSLRTQAKQRVAIIDFTATDGNDCAAGAALADEISGNVFEAKSPAVESLLERRSIADLYREQDIASSVRMDSRLGAKLGRMMGASAVLLGSVSNAAEASTVAVKLVSVETGEILSTASARVDPDAIVGRGGCGIEAPRAPAIAGDGKVYGRQTAAHKALLYLSVISLVGAAGAGGTAIGFAQDATKHCKDSGACDSTGVDDKNYAKYLGIAAGAAGGAGLLFLGIHFLIPPANPNADTATTPRLGVAFDRDQLLLRGRF